MTRKQRNSTSNKTNSGGDLVAWRQTRRVEKRHRKKGGKTINTQKGNKIRETVVKQLKNNNNGFDELVITVFWLRAGHINKK